MSELKTKFKYIHFTKMEDMQAGPVTLTTATETWVCSNNKTRGTLCFINWYVGWKQWVVGEVCPGSIFSADCLRDIAEFMAQLEGKG